MSLIHLWRQQANIRHAIVREITVHNIARYLLAYIAQRSVNVAPRLGQVRLVWTRFCLSLRCLWIHQLNWTASDSAMPTMTRPRYAPAITAFHARFIDYQYLSTPVLCDLERPNWAWGRNFLMVRYLYLKGRAQRPLQKYNWDYIRPQGMTNSNNISHGNQN